MSVLLKRLGQGSLRYGAGDVLQRGVAFLLVPVYTRYLPPSDYGIIAVVAAAGGLLTVALGFGLRGSVVRHYYDFADDPEEVRSYMGSVFVTYLAGGGALAALLYLAGPWLTDRVLRQVPFHPFISLTIWTAYVSAGGAILLGLYRAREQSWRYVALQAGGSILTLLLIVVFIVGLGRGVVGQVEGAALASALLMVLYLGLVSREVNWRYSLPKARAALVFGLPLVPHLLAGSITALFDRIVLERYVSLTDVGLYLLGYQIGMLVSFAAGAVNAAWSPIFYDTARRRSDAPSVVARLTTLYAAGIALVAASVIVFGREIIDLVAPDAYGAAAAIVPVVAVAHCFQGLYFMSVTPLFYAKKTQVVPAVTVASAALSLLLLFVLVPRFGILGAAYATLLAFLAQWALTVAVARKWYAIPYDWTRLAGAGALLLLVVVAEAATRELRGIAALTTGVATLLALVAGLMALRIVPVRSWRHLGEWLGA